MRHGPGLPVAGAVCSQLPRAAVRPGATVLTPNDAVCEGASCPQAPQGKPWVWLGARGPACCNTPGFAGKRTDAEPAPTRPTQSLCTRTPGLWAWPGPVSSRCLWPAQRCREVDSVPAAPCSALGARCPGLRGRHSPRVSQRPPCRGHIQRLLFGGVPSPACLCCE